MLEHILDGGQMMIPLVVLSILSLAVIIDRLWAFRAAESDSSKLKQTVIEEMQANNIEAAMQACESTKGPVASVLLEGLVKFKKLQVLGCSMTEIEGNVTKTMSDYAPHIVQALEKRLNILTMIASIAPLLGMTGTVTGMIASFGSMSSGLDAAKVSVGISEALVTTAGGLIVAIPAVIAHNIFKKRIDKFILDIEESATRLIDTITLEHRK